MLRPAVRGEAFFFCSRRGEGSSLSFESNETRANLLYRWVASSGALVTILALAFGTFTQQLLSFEKLPVTVGTLKPTNIPHAETWQSFTGNFAEGGEYSRVDMEIRPDCGCSSFCSTGHGRCHLQWHLEPERRVAPNFLPNWQLHLASHTFDGYLWGLFSIYIHDILLPRSLQLEWMQHPVLQLYLAIRRGSKFDQLRPSVRSLTRNWLPGLAKLRSSL